MAALTYGSLVKTPAGDGYVIGRMAGEGERYMVMHTVDPNNVHEIIKKKWHGSRCVPMEWDKSELEAA